MSAKTLEGKNALITGASRGLGEAVAKAFLEQGANVAISGRKQPALDEVAQKLSGLGGKVLPVAAHTGKVDQINALAETTAKELGSIDILVNNAATNPMFGPVMFCEEPAWDKIFEVNLKGYFFMAKACLPLMQNQGEGVIINVASVGGITYPQGMGVYGISKAGVLMLTKTLAAEWGTFNIRVNAVAPGLFKTRFSQALWAVDDVLDQVIDMQVIKRLAEPEDIVGSLVFLAGPAAGFITGQTIIVDGGSFI